MYREGRGATAVVWTWHLHFNDVMRGPGVLDDRDVMLIEKENTSSENSWSVIGAEDRVFDYASSEHELSFMDLIFQHVFVAFHLQFHHSAQIIDAFDPQIESLLTIFVSSKNHTEIRLWFFNALTYLSI